MCRRLPRLHKPILTLVLYALIYFFISIIVRPSPIYHFVKDDLRIGDKYVLIYLITNKIPVMTDSEGAEVFTKRRSGLCFITNNKGFGPISEFDAVILHGQGLPEAKEIESVFHMDVTSQCLKKKLVGCSQEPKVVSMETNESFTLDSLCRHLIAKRRNAVETNAVLQ